METLPTPLSPWLNITVRLWRCARRPIFYASLISVFVGIAIVLMRFLYTATVVDPQTGYPYKEESMVFGFYQFFIMRAVSLAFILTRKILFHRMVDYTILAQVVQLFGIFFWMSLSSLFTTFASFCGVFYAILFILQSQVYTLGTVSPFEDIKEFFSSLCRVNLYYCVISFTFVTLCFSTVVGNSVNSYVSKDISGSTTVASVTVGIALPVVKHFFLKLQALQALWQTGIPTTRAQEVNSIAMELIFIVAHESAWGLLGKLLIMRTSLNSMLIATLLSGVGQLLMRLSAVYLFKHQEEVVKMTRTLPEDVEKNATRAVSTAGADASQPTDPQMVSRNMIQRGDVFALSALSFGSSHSTLKRTEDTSSADSKYKGEEARDPVFVPLDPKVRKAIVIYGNITAEWISRLTSWLLIWILFTFPPTSVWTRCYSDIGSNLGSPVSDVILRMIFTAIVALLFEAFTVYIESKWGGYDFERAVEEFSLTPVGLYYCSCTIISTFGLVVFAESGVLPNFNTGCFLAGRRT